MAVLECVFVMCLRLRVEKWDPHSGCNVIFIFLFSLLLQVLSVPPTYHYGRSSLFQGDTERQSSLQIFPFSRVPFLKGVLSKLKACAWPGKHSLHPKGL